jgi:hypothetical protein
MNRCEWAPRCLRALTGAGFAILLLVSAAGASAVAAERAAHEVAAWTVKIDGQDVSRYNTDRPLNLSPGRPADVLVRLSNASGQRTRSVRSVRLESRILRLTFVSYETEVDLKAPPGGSDTRHYRISLLRIGRQATGLLPARVVLLDADGRTLQSRSLAIRVHGSVWSTYGMCGLAVAAISFVLLAAAVLALFRGRQHRSRVGRGLALAVPGIGIGVVLLFGLSAAGLVVPYAVEWTVVMVAGGVVGFLVGCSTPAPYRGGHEAVVLPKTRRIVPPAPDEEGEDDFILPIGNSPPARESVVMSEPMSE